MSKKDRDQLLEDIQFYKADLATCEKEAMQLAKKIVELRKKLKEEREERC